MNIFYTPDIAGDEYVLDENESKHCVRVLRQVKGDVLRLVDGMGGWYRAEITEADPRRCKVKVLEHVEEYEKRPFHLHVAIAPTKNNDRFEWFLEKATEIGIDEITPLICEHSERRNIKPERLNKVVVAAMKQSLKAYLPRLNNYTNFEAFIQNEHEGLKLIAHCDELNKTHLFHELEAGQKVLVLIGPEGDFSRKEIEQALAQGYKAVSLGQSRLRTETAGLVATQMVNLMNEIK